MLFDMFKSKREVYNHIELKIRKIELMISPDDPNAMHTAIQDCLSRMTSNLIEDVDRAMETEQLIRSICNHFSDNVNKTYDIMLLAVKSKSKPIRYAYAYRTYKTDSKSTLGNLNYPDDIIDLHYLGAPGEIWEIDEPRFEDKYLNIYIDKPGAELQEKAFKGFKHINSLNHLENVSRVESMAFDSLWYTGSDESESGYRLKFSSLLEVIDSQSCRYNDIISIDLSECTQLKNIPHKCFALCKNLREIKLPKSLEVIYSCAFMGLHKLDTLELHGAVYIKSEALYGCSVDNLIIHPDVYMAYSSRDSIRVMKNAYLFNTDCFEYWEEAEIRQWLMEILESTTTVYAQDKDSKLKRVLKNLRFIGNIKFMSYQEFEELRNHDV